MSRRRALTPEEFTALFKGSADDRHEDVVRAAINWLNLQLVAGKRVKAWRVDTGVHLHRRPDGSWGTGPSYGTKGALDITGVIPPHGRRLDVDVKCTPDKLSEDQEQFIAASRERGGLAFGFWDTLDDLERRFAAALKGEWKEN